MMNEILLQGLTLDQLLESIGKLVDDKLKRRVEVVDDSQPRYLSRAETAKLLKTTLPTLHDWTKMGWLQSYRIGKRVLYKSKEVEEALTKVLSHKHKKGGLL